MHRNMYVYRYTYRIRGNFRGSYISRKICQEGFRILIFTDDLPLNHYYYYHCLLIEIFKDQNFAVASLTVKTANFTSLENYRVYGILGRKANYKWKYHICGFQ